MDELGDVKTAVSEAVTNAIVHAYPDSLGKVELKLRLYPGNELELIVRDWGIGSVKVRSHPGKGTTVTMRKRFAIRAGGSV